MMVKGQRVVGYIRVSTAEQAASGLGLADQRQKIEDACASRGWVLVRVETDESTGKTTKNRPGLAAALSAVNSGEVDGLLVAKWDRLARKLADFVQIMTSARSAGWNLVALDRDIDLGTSSGRLNANIMASVAEWEADIISERTKDALAMKRAQGVKLGRPRTLPDDVVARIVAERQAGRSLPVIADGLTNGGVATARGGLRWYPSTVKAVLAYALP
jgi:DNA invertase Pin-like site-specific DNA recombinase